MTNLTAQEEELLTQIFASEEMLDEVMSTLDIAEDDEVLMLSVRESLKSKLSEFVVLTILENMNTDQLEHFKSFHGQKSVTDAWMTHDDIIMDFALSYPHLKEAVIAAIPGFLDEFVDGFNGAMKG